MTSETLQSPEDCVRMREMRQETEEGRATFSEIAEEFDLENMYEALLHVRGFCECVCECDTTSEADCTECEAEVQPVTDDSPWHERALMMELYAEHLMSFKEMGDRLGCHNETAQSWITDEEKHDIVYELLGKRDVEHSSSPMHRKLLLADTNWKSHIDQQQQELREEERQTPTPQV